MTGIGRVARISLAKAVGMDQVHFCIYMITTLGLGFITPPFGLNLFVMSNVTGRPVAEVLRGTVPFFLLMLVLLLLVTFFPGLTTWLPDRVMG